VLVFVAELDMTSTNTFHEHDDRSRIRNP